MKNFQERFSKFGNVENLYYFYQKTTKWSCGIFFNEKLEMIYCKGNEGKWGAVDDESMKTICRYHKLLFEFNVAMKKEFLDEKKNVKKF